MTAEEWQLLKDIVTAKGHTYSVNDTDSLLSVFGGTQHAAVLRRKAQLQEEIDWLEAQEAHLQRVATAPKLLGHHADLIITDELVT